MFLYTKKLSSAHTCCMEEFRLRAGSALLRQTLANMKNMNQNLGIRTRNNMATQYLGFRTETWAFHDPAFFLAMLKSCFGHYLVGHVARPDGWLSR